MGKRKKFHIQVKPAYSAGNQHIRNIEKLRVFSSGTDYVFYPLQNTGILYSPDHLGSSIFLILRLAEKQEMEEAVFLGGHFLTDILL